MSYCGDSGFYYKPIGLSLIGQGIHILLTGESGIKWKGIYIKIKDFQLDDKYSTGLSQNHGVSKKPNFPSS